MQSILLCEGKTDHTLLQVFLREAYGWEDEPNPVVQKSAPHIEKQTRRVLKRNDEKLTLMAVGGSSRLVEGLELVLKINQASYPPFDSFYNNIIIVTDNDDDTAIRTIIDNVSRTFLNYGVIIDGDLSECKWKHGKMPAGAGMNIPIKILVLAVPHDHHGAMETFLLDAVSESCEYEKNIVEKCRNLVATADPENRYLNQRCYFTKAEFAAYFCIRTPAEAYAERNELIKTGVKWSDYPKLRTEFGLLESI